MRKFLNSSKSVWNPTSDFAISNSICEVLELEADDFRAFGVEKSKQTKNSPSNLRTRTSFVFVELTAREFYVQMFDNESLWRLRAHHVHLAAELELF